MKRFEHKKRTPLELIEIIALEDFYDYSDAWVVSLDYFRQGGDIVDLIRARYILMTNVKGMYCRLFWKHCKYWNTSYYDRLRTYFSPVGS